MSNSNLTKPRVHRAISNVWLAVFGVFCALPAAAQDSAIGEQNKVYFKNVRLFDGSKTIESTNVLIADGKIAGIGSDVSIPIGCQTVDGAGHTLLPGLIDSHVHAFFESQLEQAALFGVTTELDMLSSPQVVAMFRTQQSQGRADHRADLFSAGSAVTVANGHGTQFGIPVPTLDSAENAASFVTERIREGSDYIKIIYEDGKAFGITRPTLTPKMLANAVVAAHAAKKMAVAHIGSQPLAKTAVKYNVNGLVHLFAESKIQQSLLEEIKDKGTFVSPTSTVVSNACGQNLTSSLIQDKHVGPLLNNQNITNLQNSFPPRSGSTNSWEILKHNIKTLHENGVPILAGTDAPNPGTVHGASLHHEIELLVKSGLTPSEALSSATMLPAKHYGLTDRGEIAVGKRADLILVKGNPTKNITDSRHIVSVYKNGKPINRTKRQSQVKKETNAARQLAPAADSILISDFDSEEITVELGSGWESSTDAMMGGTSTATLKIASGGADNSKSGLLVNGNVRERQPAFSGAMYSPGKTPMAPANLSAYKTFTFWSKCEEAGEGQKPIQVMLFFQKRGFMPSAKSINATKNWQKHAFTFAEFDGCDATDVTGIWFGQNNPGDFKFQIDQLSFESK